MAELLRIILEDKEGRALVLEGDDVGRLDAALSTALLIDQDPGSELKIAGLEWKNVTAAVLYLRLGNQQIAYPTTPPDINFDRSDTNAERTEKIQLGFPEKPIDGYPNGLHPVNPSTSLQPALPLQVEIRGRDGSSKLFPFFAPKGPPEPELPAFPPN